MVEVIKNLDWSPLFISLKTGVAATVISFFLGIYTARKVVKASPAKKAVLDGILTLPMVLPPTVAGFSCYFCLAEGGHLGFCYTNSLTLKLCRLGWGVSLQQR